MVHLLAIFGSFGLALIVTPVVQRLANFLGVLDLPGPRKIHQVPTPLLGGVAIYMALAVMTLVGWWFGLVIDLKISLAAIMALLGGGAMLMVGGYLDDRYQLKPVQQFIFPLLAVILALVGGISIRFVTNPLGGILQISELLGIGISFFWLLGMSYTTKFLDGLDGLTSGITAIGAIIIYIVSLSWDAPGSGTSYLALVLAGSCLGFLVYNWHPAKIFLGEGGSVFCGYALGVLSIISGSKIATTLLVMGIPILDVAWVIIRRWWQGTSPIMADRQHLHFRLFDAGLSHRQVVLLLYALTGTFGAASLFLSSSGKIVALVTLIGVMTTLAAFLVMVYRRKPRP